MAFVIKSEKKFNQAIGNQEVGPGSYENQFYNNLGKATRNRQNNAPFN